MIKTSDDQRVFKLILGAVASESLTPEDYGAALSSLRNGPMIKVLDQIFDALSASSARSDKAEQRQRSERKADRERSGRTKDADDVFNDIKRRKITRERLDAILDSIDNQFLTNSVRSETMRNVISMFQRKASPRQWNLLISIVNGDYEVDPYFERVD